MTDAPYYATTSTRLKLIPTDQVTMRSITAEVAAYFGLTVDDLIGPQRAHRFAHPRHAAFHACRSVLRDDGTHRYSYPQIGDYFGFRDHCTVIRGIENHLKRRAEGKPA